jgi:hypothetical protein
VDRIGLADTIEALREELAEAAKKAVDADIRFPVDSIEVEFQVGVTRTGQGSGKVSFWVIELGGGGSYSTQALQTVTVTLGKPVGPDGFPVFVSAPSEEPPR